MVLYSRFYALSAAAALLKYSEFIENKIFAPKSLKVEYQGSHNTTIIDVATASRLELVRSLQGSGSQNSLLGILNHCSTAGGTRLLRANILQPPCLPEIIRNRLDSVQEMVDHPEMFAALQLMLSKFTNVEQLLCLCMHIPQQDNTRVAEFQLKYILLLKNILELLPGLNTVLKDAHSNCLRSAREDSYSKMIAHNICALGGEYVSYCYFRQDLCSKMITHNICALGGEYVSYSRQDSCSKMIAPNICALGGEYVSYCYSRQDLCSKMIAHNICALGGEYVRYCYSRQDLCSKMIAHNICALGDYYYDLFQALSDSRFAKILERILQTLNNDARHEKNFTASHMQRNFAVKTNINGLLDVARKTYSLVSQLAEETNLPLEVGFTTARGFHIQMSLGNKRAFHDLNLPDKFIQVQRSRNNYTFTTQELVILDQRGKEILQEVQSISSVVIFGLLTDIRGQIGCLYKLTENILQLDMLVSFAHVSSINNYTRPQFSTELDVKQARHPILDFISHTTPKSNDAFASSSYNFHIITGPNMSGKSIYMRQIAMLQIMAQVGSVCFFQLLEKGHRESKSLPSQSLHDSKNLPYQGLQENRKLSSKKAKAYCSRGFKRVREMHYIKQALTPTSLVIMDELCRGTSVEDGTALTWALCEELLHTTAFFFLATHFLFVTKLQDLYYNVINHHFEVKEEETEKGRGRLVYTHCLKPGVTQVAHYGLRLAENLAMPASIVESARTVVEEILQHRKPEPRIDDNGVNEQYVYELCTQLLSATEVEGGLTVEMCRQIKERFQQKNAIASKQNGAISKPENREISLNLLEPITIMHVDQSGTVELTDKEEDLVEENRDIDRILEEQEVREEEIIMKHRSLDGSPTKQTKNITLHASI
uniref:DNA mismatch repair proteins mutS family domain-containing protein n=1 Tax=Timema tahoe TaxID=61484 RepID=A0A7R9IL74_9NEOP|nr:unnamed protein product [Timema tahoe]